MQKKKGALYAPQSRNGFLWASAPADTTRDGLVPRLKLWVVLTLGAIVLTTLVALVTNELSLVSVTKLSSSTAECG